MKRILMAAVLATAGIFSATGAFAQATPVAGAGGMQRVLVIPFSALNVPESEQWISKGITESLVAELGRVPGYSPIAFQGQLVVEDNATALRVARQTSANLVIRGAAQVVGSNVRLTAQLIDARSGDTVTTASVTGPTSDMLRLEDELTAQIRGLPGATASAPVTGAPAAPAAGQTPNQAPAYPYPYPMQQPQVVVISQPQAQPSYEGYAGYPDGGYAGYGGYPYGIYPNYGFFPAVFTSVVYSNRGFCGPVISRPPVCNVPQACVVSGFPNSHFQPIPGVRVTGDFTTNGNFRFSPQPVSIPSARGPGPAGPPAPAPVMRSSPGGGFGGRTSFISTRSR